MGEFSRRNEEQIRDAVRDVLEQVGIDLVKEALRSVLDEKTTILLTQAISSQIERMDQMHHEIINTKSALITFTDANKAHREKIYHRLQELERKLEPIEEELRAIRREIIGEGNQGE